MNRTVRSATACIVLLCGNVAIAQEMTTATYVGSLEGAAQACATVFPDKAGAYKDSLERFFKCHVGPEKFAQWHKELRSSTTSGAQYQKAFEKGKASLESNPGVRKDQCRFLEQLACEPNSPPR